LTYWDVIHIETSPFLSLFSCFRFLAFDFADVEELEIEGNLASEREGGRGRRRRRSASARLPLSLPREEVGDSGPTLLLNVASWSLAVVQSEHSGPPVYRMSRGRREDEGLTIKAVARKTLSFVPPPRKEFGLESPSFACSL